MKFRIGHGFDIHRLEAGEGLALGGVFIPCAYKVIAHSDGDVAIHALCDALLGAIAAGDIGKLFPDTDARYQGISSLKLLAEVMQHIRGAGYAVGNADISVVAEAPKLAPHILKMRAALAVALGVETDCVNVKATTNEGLGHLGRREGIAAHAVVLLQGT